MRLPSAVNSSWNLTTTQNHGRMRQSLNTTSPVGDKCARTLSMMMNDVLYSHQTYHARRPSTRQQPAAGELWQCLKPWHPTHWRTLRDPCGLKRFRTCVHDTVTSMLVLSRMMSFASASCTLICSKLQLNIRVSDAMYNRYLLDHHTCFK